MEENKVIIDNAEVQEEIVEVKTVAFDDIELMDDEEITEETLIELSDNKGDED